MSFCTLAKSALVAGLLLLNAAAPATALVGGKTFGERVRQRNARSQGSIVARDVEDVAAKNTSTYRYLDKNTKRKLSLCFVFHDCNRSLDQRC